MRLYVRNAVTQQAIFGSSGNFLAGPVVSGALAASIAGMDTISTHYARLLGLDDSWRADAADLRLDERRVAIRRCHVSTGVSCPECGQSCGLADHAEERRWRHLDTMQFTTELVARLPRCRCPDHGVKTIVPPWAGKHSRFTLFFEAFAIEVLQAPPRQGCRLAP